jgi:hypothetical protein
MLQAASELRRLAQVNAELLGAINHALVWFEAAGYQVPAYAHLHKAALKAKEQQ